MKNVTIPPNVFLSGIRFDLLIRIAEWADARKPMTHTVDTDNPYIFEGIRKIGIGGAKQGKNLLSKDEQAKAEHHARHNQWKNAAAKIRLCFF